MKRILAILTLSVAFAAGTFAVASSPLVPKPAAACPECLPPPDCGDHPCCIPGTQCSPS